MVYQQTKRDELKTLSAERAQKYGSKPDNHALGLEYLALEILAHHPVIANELINDENPRQLDIARFHTGGANDGGIDGLLFNEELTHVFVVQTKFKTGPIDSDTLEEARSFFGRLSEWINPELRDTYSPDTIRLLDDSGLSPVDQEIHLYFLTAMSATEKPLYENLADEFTNLYREKNWNVTCHLLTQSEVLQRHQDSFNSKVSTLVPSLGFKIGKNSQFIFSEGEYRVLVCAIKGNEIGSLYNQTGVRNKLFNLNVRAALLATGKINQKIRETAQSENDSGNFFYFNNGITATCSRFDLNGVEVTAENLQIVNGAQTVAALADAVKSNRARSNVYVMFRVIETEGGKHKNAVADQITRFQNTQNPVKVSDFFSNEPIHKAIERAINEKSGKGAFPSVWYEYKRGIKSVGTAGRKKLTLENLAYIRYACLVDAPFTYKTAKDIWDGVENSKHFWSAMGIGQEQVSEWSDEEVAKTGWMIRCWLYLREEQKTLPADTDSAAANKERVYLGVMSRYITALAFYGMEHLRSVDNKFSSYTELMGSEKFCRDTEKEMIRVARRIVRTDYTKSWEGRVANPRLNMPQNSETWTSLRSELLSEYYL